MRHAVALAWLGLLFAAEPPGKPRLDEPRVGLDGRRLEVSFKLIDGFNEDLLERIRTGLPSGYVFDIRLLRDRKRWFDVQIDSSRLEVVASYNAVTREYLVNTKQDGKLIESRVVRDERELERALTRFESVPVFNLESGGGRRRLLIRMRAEIDSSNFLFFIPRRVATPWRYSRKFPPPQ
jgi:hypothetical protein